jgi:hypothetical protein
MEARRQWVRALMHTVAQAQDDLETQHWNIFMLSDWAVPRVGYAVGAVCLVWVQRGSRLILLNRLHDELGSPQCGNHDTSTLTYEFLRNTFLMIDWESHELVGLYKCFDEGIQ